jgi:rubrerythrin
MRYKILMLLPMILLAPFSRAAAREDNAPLVILRGRIKCLDGPCDGASPRFGLTTPDEKLYNFLEGDELAAIFLDPRVRSHELQITARLHTKDRLEIIKVKSIINGRIYDLYYFCEVCNITAYAPGPCPCCRKELELRETPLP